MKINYSGLNMRNITHNITVEEEQIPNISDIEEAIIGIENIKNGKRYYLDSLADLHCSPNEKGLIEVTPERLTINGISGDTISEARGYLPGIGEIHIIPTSQLNVMSWNQLEEIADIRYIQGIAVICKLHNGLTLIFKRDENGYGCNIGSETAEELAENGNRAYLTKVDRRAIKVRMIARRLGYPSDKTLIQYLSNNEDQLDISANEVRRAAIILGPEQAVVKGKFGYKRKRYMRPQYVTYPKEPLDMNVDLMHWDKHVFVIAKLKPINAVMTRPVIGRDGNNAIYVLEKMIRIVQAYGFTIRRVVIDPERALKYIDGRLSVPTQPVGARNHVVVAEREIRTIKDRMRTIIAGLEYKIPNKWIPKLVEYVSIILNILPRTDMDVPARELLTGEKVNISRDFRCYFGEIVEAELPNADGTKNKSVEAVALRPEFTAYGSWIFLNLTTKREISATKWATVSLTPNIMGYIKEEMVEGRNTLSMSIDTGKQSLAVDTPTDDVPPDQRPGIESNGETSLENTNTTDPGSISPDEGTNIEETDEEIIMNMNRRIDDDYENLANLGYVVVDGVRKSLRISRARQDLMEHRIYSISLKKAIQSEIPGARVAITAELNQMLTKGVFEPVQRNAVDGQLIGSHLFLTEKRDEFGQFVKWKARLVALGNTQDKCEERESSSPTISHEAIMLSLGLTASRRWKLATIDVTGAFLEAVMPPSEPLYMELSGEVAKIICDLDNSYKYYRDALGRVVVKLKRAIYGCQQSGLLWYNTLICYLREQGFKTCDYDNCLLRKEGMLVGIHVDDLLLMSETDKGIQDFKDNMSKRFGGITFNEGETLIYLGMRIRINEIGISCDMCEYTARVIEEFGDRGESKTPGSNELLIDDLSEPLDENERIKFHAVVAKLLYLVKRCRPDCLLVVSKLSGRVTCANQGDLNKLNKLMGYLSGTKNFGILIKWDIPFKIEFFVDASYMSDSEGRSRTGVVMTINGYALACWTSKQKLVARSSTEAELIGLSEGLTHALWIRHCLKDMNAGHECMTIFQDNESSIHITKNGRNTGQRTRHLDVRYFHAIDCVKKGEIDVTYIPTQDMLADYFTKPLNGTLFYKHRERIVCDLNSILSIGDKLN
jgi:hypothetical protein